MKPKWIAGLAAMCLLTAAVASVMTAAALTGNLLGLNLRPGSQETSTTGQPEPTLSPLPTPTSRPTATQPPTPSPTITPTPAPDPTFTDPGASERLYILQTQELIARVYEKASQSVVSIEVAVMESGSSIIKANQGSGLILSATGEIATNAAILSIALDKQGNILSNATLSVKIKGVDKPFVASFIGQDIMTGLAVLKIDSADLVLVPGVFADNTGIKVGQIVLAVGYPEILYEAGGLSSGLITGINRTVLLEDGTPVQMIQTNAPVSLACSGGPLLNLDGEVIGLTNCAVTREAVDSLSYVLPAGAVQTVAGDLIANGQVSGRSWLGISVLSESSFLTLQTLYGFPDGLYISNVIKDSPAYTADLRKGDIITEINGEETGVAMNMSKFLQSQPVGTQLLIRVYRRSDGKYHELKAYLQEKIN